jgi:hypothetical protein
MFTRKARLQPAEFFDHLCKTTFATQSARKRTLGDVHATSNLLTISDIRRLSPHQKYAARPARAKLRARKKNVQVDVAPKRQNK